MNEKNTNSSLTAQPPETADANRPTPTAEKLTMEDLDNVSGGMIANKIMGSNKNL